MDTSQAYKILKIPQGASFGEIKSAYRKMVLESHPDRNESNQGDVEFRLVTEAYHVLKNNRSNTNEAPTKKRADQKTEKEKTFTRTNWGANQDKIPEADWEKYTRQTEQSDPAFWQKYVSDFWKDYDASIKQTKKNPFDFEITQESKNESKVFSSVDHSLCIGCCSCETIAPQVFSVDKTSKVNPKSNVINQSGAKIDRIIDAAQTCPTKAIKVEDTRTGKRLYPY